MDFTIKRGDPKDLIFFHAGDITAQKIIFVCKANKVLTSARLIEKKNAAAGGSTAQITAVYENSETKITVKLAAADTQDFTALTYYHDTTAQPADNSTDPVTIDDGTLSIDQDVQTPYDGTDLPEDAQRYIPYKLLLTQDKQLIQYEMSTGTLYGREPGEFVDENFYNKTEVDAKELALQQADMTLQTNIDAEASARSAADTALNNAKVDKTTTVNGHALNENVIVTKADIELGNADNTSDANKPISSATSTALGLKADLVDGKIPSTQLPSYVDDVVEAANFAALPATGETGKIYVTLDTNLTYRWSGTVYAEISQSLALGETSTTAYRGDRGKTAYDHSQAAHAPSNAQKNSDITKAEIEAKLTGEIATHSHPASANLPTADQKAAMNTVNPASATNKFLTQKDISSSDYNDIKVGNYPGAMNSICPTQWLPPEVVPMYGTFDPTSDNYGNYQCVVDGSVMVYRAAWVYKISTGNHFEVRAFKYYDYNHAAAVADGFVICEDFINAGQIMHGCMYDKYDPSLTNFVYNTSGIMSSIKNGNPISSSVDTKRNTTNNFAGSFSNCKSNGQSPSDIYAGGIAAVKSRGPNFVYMGMRSWKGNSILSMAHAQAVTSTSYCAWYDATGVKNFPRGNNNYGSDYNDPTVTWAACDDGYWASRNEARKTGSASNFAMSTDNGQNCGIADVQGNQYKIAPDITCVAVSKNITSITRATEAVFRIVGHGYTTGMLAFIDGTDTTEWQNLLQYMFVDIEVINVDTFKLKKRTNDVNNGTYVNTSALSLDYDGSGFTLVTGTFYALKETVDVKTITGGNILATDHWGATGVAAMFDQIDLSDLLINKYSSDRFGNGSNDVLGMSTDRTSNIYKLTSLGLPKNRNAISSGGTNQFGADTFYKYIRNELCALVSGSWPITYSAGVWLVHFNSSRTDSGRGVSARARLLV